MFLILGTLHLMQKLEILRFHVCSCDVAFETMSKLLFCCVLTANADIRPVTPLGMVSYFCTNKSVFAS